MTAFTAPPDKTGLVLNHGDFLTVKSGGTAIDTTINGGFADVLPQGTADDTTINEGGRLSVFGTSNNTTINDGGIENAFGMSTTGTTINDGGIENVRGMSTRTTINDGGIEDVGNRGTDFSTTINRGGTENVRDGGEAIKTTINTGGVENVHEFGTSTGAVINGGTENVFGEANNTTINTGGIENVHEFGIARNVTFGGPQATLELANPFGLMALSTISNWHVGDVIDFLNTTVTSVFETEQHTSVTVRFDIGRTSLAVKYFLAGQQANTEFKLASDGHGGTDLILTPLVGVLHHEAAIHFGPGPHF